MHNNDIIKTINDTLHFPKLAQAYNNLSTFDRRDLEKVFEDALNDEYSRGYKECMYEYDDGFEDGQNELYSKVIQKLKSEFEDESQIKVSKLIEIINEARR